MAQNVKGAGGREDGRRGCYRRERGAMEYRRRGAMKYRRGVIEYRRSE